MRTLFHFSGLRLKIVLALRSMSVYSFYISSANQPVNKMINAKQTFDAAMKSVIDSEFNVSNLSCSTISDRNELIAACVYAAFSDAVFASTMTRREKQLVYDAINPTIEGATCADDRKTIPILRTQYLTRPQIATITAIVSAAI
jgi:hypothetical protein